MKVTINNDVRTVTFDGADGSSLTFHASRASKECNEYATMHGWKQRLADKMAVGVADNGRRLPDGEKLAILKPLVDHYESGTAEWEMRVGGGAASVLVRALVAAGLMSDTPEMRAKVRGWNATQRAAIEQSPEVKVELDRIRSEAVKDIDTVELFGQLA